MVQPSLQKYIWKRELGTHLGIIHPPSYFPQPSQGFSGIPPKFFQWSPSCPKYFGKAIVCTNKHMINRISLISLNGLTSNKTVFSRI